MRLYVTPWLFRLPWFRRFDGYALHGTILLRREPQLDDDLLTHELCHVWQMQHRAVAMPLSYLRHGYASNPYEAEARLAAAQTSGIPAAAHEPDDQGDDRQGGQEPAAGRAGREL